MPGAPTVAAFSMVAVRGGQFSMGSPSAEQNRRADEGPLKNIAVSAFWMSSREVTRDDFDVFYKDESSSQNADADAVTRPSAQYIDFSLGMGKEGGYPVNSLSQHAALMYCRWLYTKTGIFYRLPTEAEWEYACRAGSKDAWFFGKDSSRLGEYAWYDGNSGNKFHPVGLKKPNAFGLYDMLGNVSEWTLDQYDAESMSKLADNSNDPEPAFSPTRYPKVVRGGGYDDSPATVRSAARIKSEPAWNRRDPQVPKSKWWLTEASSVGFRIVRPLKKYSDAEINAFYNKWLGQ